MALGGPEAVFQNEGSLSEAPLPGQLGLGRASSSHRWTRMLLRHVYEMGDAQLQADVP